MRGLRRDHSVFPVGFRNAILPSVSRAIEALVATEKVKMYGVDNIQAGGGASVGATSRVNFLLIVEAVRSCGRRGERETASE